MTQILYSLPPFFTALLLVGLAVVGWGGWFLWGAASLPGFLVLCVGVVIFFQVSMN